VQSGHNTGLVYIYRPSSIPYARNATIVINGKEIFDLPSGEYTWVELSPGAYKLVAEWPRDTLILDADNQLNVEPGKTYYVRVSASALPPAIGIIGGLPILVDYSTVVLVKEEKALFELNACTPISGLVIDGTSIPE